MNAGQDFAGLVVQVMLPLALLVAAGGGWGGRIDEATRTILRAQLNRLVLYLFYPAILFAVAAGTPLSLTLLSVPLLNGLGTLGCALLLWLMLYRSPLGAGLRDTTRAALMLGGMFGNTFNIGVPVLEFFFGHGAVRYAVFNDQFMTMPLIWTLGVWIATRLGSHADGAAPNVLRVVLTLPPIWAFFAGMGAHYAGLDFPPLIQAARFIGQATIPVMLFVLGLTIPWRSLALRSHLLWVSAVKLLFAPMLVWAIALAWSNGHLCEAHRAAVVEAATPTFMTSLLLADRFGLDSAAMALLIGWSTLLFWASLPLLMAFGAFG